MWAPPLPPSPAPTAVALGVQCHGPACILQQTMETSGSNGLSCINPIKHLTVIENQYHTQSSTKTRLPPVCVRLRRLRQCALEADPVPH